MYKEYYLFSFFIPIYFRLTLYTPLGLGLLNPCILGDFKHRIGVTSSYTLELSPILRRCLNKAPFYLHLLRMTSIQWSVGEATLYMRASNNC